MEAFARVYRRRRRQDVDRISSLPDSILCHILSFLSTKYSVRTSALSTRWKSLFSHVPLLDFDPYDSIINYDSMRRFINFVNSVLKVYKYPQIARFRLICSYWFHDDLVNWILYAIRHKVQELDISVRLDEPKTIPRELFSSETLSVLKLRGKFSLNLLLPSLASRALLPSLKTLELGLLTFDIPDQRILSICPVLEDLILHQCKFENEEVLEIISTSLRRLRIDKCCCDELVLDAPNLMRFDYLNSYIVEFVGGNVLTSLVEAEIDHDFDLNMETDEFVYPLLNVVFHARRLYLSMDSFLAMYNSSDDLPPLPTFHNLTRLEVGEVSQAVYDLLFDFLNNSSILEVLVFSEGICHGELHFVDAKDDKNVPSCVLRHLKEIEFRSFTMEDLEWKLVEYFLKNARVLQKMKIQSSLSLKKQYNLSKKVSTFTRFSKDCQIVFEFDDPQVTRTMRPKILDETE